jgi:hypothetical protein
MCECVFSTAGWIGSGIAVVIVILVILGNRPAIRYGDHRDWAGRKRKDGK